MLQLYALKDPTGKTIFVSTTTRGILEYGVSSGLCVIQRRENFPTQAKMKSVSAPPVTVGALLSTSRYTWSPGYKIELG